MTDGKKTKAAKIYDIAEEQIELVLAAINKSVVRLRENKDTKRIGFTSPENAGKQTAVYSGIGEEMDTFGYALRRDEHIWVYDRKIRIQGDLEISLLEELDKILDAQEAALIK